MRADMGSVNPVIAPQMSGLIESTLKDLDTRLADAKIAKARRFVRAERELKARVSKLHERLLATQDGADAPDPTVPAVERWLNLQGVRGPVERHRLARGDVGERLLVLATALDADLLVMGCYGHSRAREWVLGGVSRTVLQSMTLPVLAPAKRSAIE